MVRIFISYVEEDGSVVEELAAYLEKAGHKAWYYERDGLPVHSYLRQTRQEIVACDAFLLVVSSRSTQSHQVDKEVVRAHECGKPIVPVLVDLDDAEFEKLCPDWDQAAGSVTSLRIPPEGVASIGPRLLLGLSEVLRTANRRNPANPGSPPASPHPATLKATVPSAGENAPPPARTEPGVGDEDSGRSRRTFAALGAGLTVVAMSAALFWPSPRHVEPTNTTSAEATLPVEAGGQVRTEDGTLLAIQARPHGGLPSAAATVERSRADGGPPRKAGDVSRVTLNGVPIEFAWIPPGEFEMGCSPGDIECFEFEQPRHRVRITKGFEFGKFEVTQAQWEAMMGNNPSHFKGPDRPVETVSWEDAQAFLKELNERSDGHRYRLPTEAEWEYAARAGSTAARYGDLDRIAWYSNNSGGGTKAIGGKAPNAWGLHDMLGNVWEWCQDWYDENYYQGGPGADPAGPSSGSSRALRGGSWDSNPRVLRASGRFRFAPSVRGDVIGFRLVREAL